MRKDIKYMEINVTALREMFEPFDVSHLLRLWIALAFFTLLWGVQVAVSGGYTTKQFWKVYSLVTCVLFVLGGIGFLLFHLDPLLLLLGLLALAFIVQGDPGMSDQETSWDDWWGFRLYRRTQEIQREEEQEKE